MIVNAIDTDGGIVKSCTISDNYQATNVYVLVKAGDASTHDGKVMAWQFIDRAGRVVEEIRAPAYR